MSWLKQSTAVTLLIGPFLDDTTGKDAETGLTVSQADVRLSKNGGNMAQKHESTACTHDEIGFYTCPLDTTDTNTLGILQICVHESGALPVFITHEIVPANVWDSYFSTDKLQVDCTQIEGGDATDALSAATPTVTLANDAITAAKFDESTAFPLKSADTGATAVARTGADSDTLETLSVEIAAVKADTGNIVTDTNELQTDWHDGGRLDLLLDGASAPSAASVADAVWDEAIAGHAGVGSTGAALAAAGGSGDPWSTALPGAYGAGTAGKIIGDNINATVGSRSSHDAAAVKTAVEAAGSHLTLIKAKTDNLPASPAAVGSNMGTVSSVTGNVGGSVASVTAGVSLAADAVSAAALKADAVAEIADGVWDEIISGHSGAGSTGAALAAAGGSGDPWSTALPGAYGSGTAGKIIGDNINAPIGTVDTVVDAIKAVTDAIGATGSGLSAVPWNASWDAEVQSECTDAITAASLPTAAQIKTAIEAAGSHLTLIKTKTDNIPASPAAVGSAMALADDAITAAKFDESTAFPVKSADTGATKIARVGADSDTLETLSNEIAAVHAKTTNLPASPAATGAEMDLVDAPNATALVAIIDALLETNLGAGTDTESRSVRNALRALRNKAAIAAGTLTVYKEDDSTSAWTAAVTTDPAAEPITVIDPA